MYLQSGKSLNDASFYHWLCEILRKETSSSLTGTNSQYTRAISHTNKSNKRFIGSNSEEQATQEFVKHMRSLYTSLDYTYAYDESTLVYHIIAICRLVCQFKCKLEAIHDRRGLVKNISEKDLSKESLQKLRKEILDFTSDVILKKLARRTKTSFAMPKSESQKNCEMYLEAFQQRVDEFMLTAQK